MPSLPSIPSNVLQYIEQAAKGTGLPQSVVAAQNYVESSYGSNNGPSSTGAEGPWQFEPTTWAGLTSQSFSNANNWSDSTPIYIKFMNQLLKQENGNVRDALAAYNAGAGNISAGYGYADGILALAYNGNVPVTVTVGTPGPSSSSGNNNSNTNPPGGLSSVQPSASGISGITQFLDDIPGLNLIIGTASGLSDIATAFQAFTNDFTWMLDRSHYLFEPSFWLRIGAFFAGTVLLGFGIYMLAKAADPDLHLPSASPIPVPLPI